MKEYMKKLKWNISRIEVEKTIKNILADKNFDYKDLILPPEGKEYWENCAKILVHIEDEEFIKLIPDLLIWFKDLNWPGGNIILNKIKEQPKQIIEEPVLEIMEKAMKEKDYQWIEFLLHIDNIKTEKVVNKMLEYTEILDCQSAQVIIEWFKELPEELKSNKVLEWIYYV